MAQAKTALAETPGSRFLADCENLVRENKFDELINRLSSHLDVIFAKASEKGEHLIQKPAAGHCSLGS
jgi:hypothetical protein